jgi:hypothetical protein
MKQTNGILSNSDGEMTLILLILVDGIQAMIGLSMRTTSPFGETRFILKTVNLFSNLSLEMVVRQMINVAKVHLIRLPLEELSMITHPIRHQLEEMPTLLCLIQILTANVMAY